MDQKQQKPKETHHHHHHQSEKGSSRPPVWDCGSSLYDSFELKSFERQLDSAITSTRTLSMPHLTSSSSYKQPQPKLPQKQQQQQQPNIDFSKKSSSSKFSRSFHKLLRSLFRPKQHRHRSQDGFYVVYDTSGTLSTIPELPEMAPDYDALSPEMKSLVRRTTSDRLTAASIAGISCA
ncbi:hypothetical protein LguiA_015755 [Lonicera macranthoides]